MHMVKKKKKNFKWESLFLPPPQILVSPLKVTQPPLSSFLCSFHKMLMYVHIYVSINIISPHPLAFKNLGQLSIYYHSAVKGKIFKGNRSIFTDRAIKGWIWSWEIISWYWTQKLNISTLHEAQIRNIFNSWWIYHNLSDLSFPYSHVQFYILTANIAIRISL